MDPQLLWDFFCGGVIKSDELWVVLGLGGFLLSVVLNSGWWVCFGFPQSVFSLEFYVMAPYFDFPAWLGLLAVWLWDLVACVGSILRIFIAFLTSVGQVFL